MKKLFVILMVVVLVFGAAACSMENPVSQPSPSATEAVSDEAQASESPDDSTDGVIKVGFTVQDLTNEYFVTLIKGIQDHQAEYGIELYVNDAKSDATAQVTAIENFVTQGMDIIVICPIDPVAPQNAVKEAQAAGIPVISWSEFVDESAAFLTLDQHQYGFTAGVIAGNWIKEKFTNEADAKVLYIFVPEVTALAERGQGLKDGLASIAPNVTIVGEQAGNTPEAGMKAAETMLTSNPDLNVIVCGNDAAALGAYQAMAAAGKKPGEVCIVGCDANSEAIAKIKEGSMYVGTVDIGTYNQGEKFLALAKKVFEEGPQPDPVFVDFIPVTSENISNY